MRKSWFFHKSTLKVENLICFKKNSKSFQRLTVKQRYKRKVFPTQKKTNLFLFANSKKQKSFVFTWNNSRLFFRVGKSHDCKNFFSQQTIRSFIYGWLVWKVLAVSRFWVFIKFICTQNIWFLWDFFVFWLGGWSTKKKHILFITKKIENKDENGKNEDLNSLNGKKKDFDFENQEKKWKLSWMDYRQIYQQRLFLYWNVFWFLKTANDSNFCFENKITGVCARPNSDSLKVHMSCVVQNGDLFKVQRVTLAAWQSGWFRTFGPWWLSIFQTVSFLVSSGHIGDSHA